jgi:hypothetical protein
VLLGIGKLQMRNVKPCRLDAALRACHHPYGALSGGDAQDCGRYAL